MREWLEDVVITIAATLALASMGAMAWFLYEVVWMFKCAFGGIR